MKNKIIANNESAKKKMIRIIPKSNWKGLTLDRVVRKGFSKGVMLR